MDQDELISFTSSLVTAPSLSGEEGNVAALICAEMERIGYDDVWTDEVGNVIGKLAGGDGPTIMLNGHMDVVDVGDHATWTHPPYCGTVVDGELWGRGSVDMKGPVAAMIHGAARLKKDSVGLAGDVYMTAAVMEEIGGLGSQFIATHLSADAAIVGEPSRCELRLGHRGRFEIEVIFHGKSAHASAPDLAINPNFSLAAFLRRLSELQLADDPILGPATIAPTIIATDNQSRNVIPAEASVFLDWRNVPSETPEAAIAAIEAMANQAATETFGADAVEPTVRITEKSFRTYNGNHRDFRCIFLPFATAADSTLAVAAGKAIGASTSKPLQTGVWQFATDGGHLAAAGIPVVGFGPGDDRLAHTNRERIDVAELELAAKTYGPMIVALQEAARV